MDLLAVDTDMAGCGTNDPSTLNCKKFEDVFVADKNGSPRVYNVGP